MKKNILLLAILGLLCVSESAFAFGSNLQYPSGEEEYPYPYPSGPGTKTNPDGVPTIDDPTIDDPTMSQ